MINRKSLFCNDPTARGTVFDQNSALLEQAVRQRISCPKFPPKSNQKTYERC